MSWITDLFSKIPQAALGPAGPHPNESLKEIGAGTVDQDMIDKVLSAPFKGPLAKIPVGMAEAIKTYGNPADPKNPEKVNDAWAKVNLVVARDLPGTWNNQPSGKCKLYVHQDAEPYLRQALKRLEAVGLLDEIETIGCYNYRHIRHQKTGPLSYHASGVAFDLNSDKNFGVYEAKTVIGPRNRPVPEPFTNEWYQIWPHGLSSNVVKAFESVGFEWGGRWHGYVDNMHMQLVKTR